MTILYPTHNRLEYNQMTLPVILAAAKNRKVIVIDDMSTDGTWEWLQAYPLPLNASLTQHECGNSTSQWMWGLQDDLVANFCNDVLIHEDAFDYIELQMHRLPDILGLSPVRGTGATIGDEDFKLHTYNGCGVYRTKMFETYGAIAPSILEGEERFFGFTAYQEAICRKKQRHLFIRDEGHTFVELDFSPLSRVKEYSEKGYSRDLTPA